MDNSMSISQMEAISLLKKEGYVVLIERLVPFSIGDLLVNLAEQEICVDINRVTLKKKEKLIWIELPKHKQINKIKEKADG